MGSEILNLSFICEISRVASRECPPDSKKLSWMPAATSVCSSDLPDGRRFPVPPVIRGGAGPVSGWVAVAGCRSWRTLRLSLPDCVNGAGRRGNFKPDGNHVGGNSFLIVPRVTVQAFNLHYTVVQTQNATSSFSPRLFLRTTTAASSHGYQVHLMQCLFYFDDVNPVAADLYLEVLASLMHKAAVCLQEATSPVR